MITGEEVVLESTTVASVDDNQELFVCSSGVDCLDTGVVVSGAFAVVDKAVVVVGRTVIDISVEVTIGAVVVTSN